MSTSGYTHAGPASSGGRLQQLIDAGARLLVAAWTASRNRRSVGRLLEWDDHMLSDIGLTQGDVRSALAARFAEDPSLRLDVLSGERRSAVRAEARERVGRRCFGVEI